MNREEHLLTIFSEECSELAQEISKALRFGINEQRDLPTSNHDRMLTEFNQLLAMKDLLNEEFGYDLHEDIEIQKAKRKKVFKYLDYSKELGTLTE